MNKVALLLVSLTTLAFSAQKTFFVQVPPMRYWTAGNPVLVEYGDGIAHQMQNAGGYGWFSYTWEDVEPSDDVYIYSAKDSLLESPLGLNYYKGKKGQTHIPVSILMETFGLDSIFYIPDDDCWLDDDIDNGIYLSDVRSMSLCNASFDRLDTESVEMNVYVVFPTYDKWDDEIPVIVDAEDFDYRREMTSVDSKKFLFSWTDEELFPEHIYIFLKSDSLMEHPIGFSGLDYPTGLLGDYIKKDVEETSLSLEKCFLNSGLRMYETNPNRVIANCNIVIAPIALFYSVYTEDDSLVVPEHRSMDSTEIAYFDGAQGIRINKEIPLGDGNYVLKYVFYGKAEKPLDGKLEFTVKDGEYVSRSVVMTGNPISQIRVRALGKNLFISGAKNESYSVFNSMGQVIARGLSVGSVTVPLPAPGMYLVKIGNEMHRVSTR